MDIPIRIKRSFFYFRLNVTVEIRLLAKFDYCTIVAPGLILEAPFIIMIFSHVLVCDPSLTISKAKSDKDFPTPSTALASSSAS